MDGEFKTWSTNKTAATSTTGRTSAVNNFLPTATVDDITAQSLFPNWNIGINSTCLSSS